MDLPPWVLARIAEYEAMPTGRVVITVERYQGGVTKVEIGEFVRASHTKT